MSLNEIMQACREKHPNWDESEIFLWAKAKQLVSPDAAKSVGAGKTSWRQLLAAINCPVLLVTGDPALGGIINQETASEAMRILPNGNHVHIPGAGHNIRRDQYQQYASNVRGFLRKYGRRK
jgi:pimeloyl-ACP methyl ester carboxylesterase